MKKLTTLILLLALSGALFIGVFSVVHRPLVVGEIQRQLDYKLGYARTLASPKILILAGSNGRFSHRCAALSQALDRPCVNGSIGVGIGLDFQLEQWDRMLRAGDLVYLPLEYSQYAFTNAQMHAGLQNALLVHSQQPYLWSLPWQRVAAAYGSFDLPFLVHGLVEMALDRQGFRRRSSTDSLTPQGDEQGHTVAAGRHLCRGGACGPRRGGSRARGFRRHAGHRAVSAPRPRPRRHGDRWPAPRCPIRWRWRRHRSSGCIASMPRPVSNCWCSGIGRVTRSSASTTAFTT